MGAIANLKNRAKAGKRSTYEMAQAGMAEGSKAEEAADAKEYLKTIKKVRPASRK